MNLTYDIPKKYIKIKHQHKYVRSLYDGKKGSKEHYKIVPASAVITLILLRDPEKLRLFAETDISYFCAGIKPTKLIDVMLVTLTIGVASFSNL